jgi:hypothetical protein
MVGDSRLHISQYILTLRGRCQPFCVSRITNPVSNELGAVGLPHTFMDREAGARNFGLVAVAWCGIPRGGPDPQY